jgi:hypothetical protein
MREGHTLHHGRHGAEHNAINVSWFYAYGLEDRLDGLIDELRVIHIKPLAMYGLA